jgi:hypothetical protein
MYILYENEFNENVHHEQDKLIRWINEAARLNPEISLDVLLSAAKDWVDRKKYSITTLSGYNPAHPEGAWVEPEPVVETVVERVEVENTERVEALQAQVDELLDFIKTLENKNNVLEAELAALREASNNVIEDAAEGHVTHSVAQEDAIVELDDYIAEQHSPNIVNIEDTLTPEEAEEYMNSGETHHDIATGERTWGEIEEDVEASEIEETVSEEVAVEEVEETLVEEAVEEGSEEPAIHNIDEFFQAQDEADGPKRSINDTVDFSKRKRGRKGSALAALADDGDDIENMSTTDDMMPVGRGDRSKRRPQRFSMTDEKQSRIRDNLVAIYSDPDALKDL